jgi:DNA-binding FadR family transcriptional regulator
VVEAVNPDPDYVHPKGMHHSVVDAVVAGNAEAAAEAMKKHTIDFGEKFIKMEITYRAKNSRL